MPQLPKTLQTAYRPSAFHKELKNNYWKMPQLPMYLQTAHHQSVCCRRVNIIDKITDGLCEFQRAVH
jgi:hypothetical protein